jgi:hypothetical protein
VTMKRISSVGDGGTDTFLVDIHCHYRGRLSGWALIGTGTLYVKLEYSVKLNP